MMCGPFYNYIVCYIWFRVTPRNSSQRHGGIITAPLWRKTPKYIESSYALALRDGGKILAVLPA